MKTLYILKKYNNYFNRIVKKEATITDYIIKSNSYNVINNANFVYADGVSTTHVHRFPVGTASFEGDYLLVVDNGVIESRWFILENMWDRAGQYILTLRRDLIIDFYSEFKDSAFYCTNGMPREITQDMALGADAAVYNKEPLEFNQCKVDIQSLTDPSKTPWIVLFVEPHFGSNTGGSVSVTYNYNNAVTTVNLSTQYVSVLDDAPYAAITMPLLDSKITYTTGGSTINVNTTMGRTLAFVWALQQSLVTDDQGNILSGVKVYDSQIVPYCPLGQEGYLDNNWKYRTDGERGLTGGSVNIVQESVYLAVLPVKNAKTYRYQDYTNAVGSFNAWSTVFDQKIGQTRMIRLTDQFGSSFFDFTPAYNMGGLNMLIAQTIKPWQTSVYIRPQWEYGGLYNVDNMGDLSEDKRGLVCKGPFTIPTVIDAWQNYATNNVNYSKAFDRQIQNIETNNAISNKVAKISGVLGIAQAGIGGFSSGSKSGPAGALGGAVASAAGSSIGFNIDYNARLATQQEQIDYSKDMFAMQLGNIRAIPDSITNISAFDWMSPWWPLMEFYASTPSEVEWLLDHIKYHGCTINHISTFAKEVANVQNQELIDGERLTEFISGTLLRCNLEDTHTANELATELMKGVYWVQ